MWWTRSSSQPCPSHGGMLLSIHHLILVQISTSAAHSHCQHVRAMFYVCCFNPVICDLQYNHYILSDTTKASNDQLYNVFQSLTVQIGFFLAPSEPQGLIEDYCHCVSVCSLRPVSLKRTHSYIVTRTECRNGQERKKKTNPFGSGVS